MPNPCQEPPASMNQDLKNMGVLFTFKTKYRAKMQNMHKSKTNNHNHIKIQKSNTSQEPPASLKHPNQDLEDMAVLFTLKINIWSQNSQHGCIENE